MASTTKHTSRSVTSNRSDSSEALDLDVLSDDELEALLFEEDTDAPKGPLNIPTIAGVSLLAVGAGYVLQQLGIWTAGIDLTALATLLPWLAGLLILLMLSGVFSWRPGRRRKRSKAEKKLAASQADLRRAREAEARPSGRRTGRKLRKSHDKKVAGVAAGLAEYFGIDPTLVRIGFMIGAIASGGGPFLLAYLVLALVMPKQDSAALEPSASERITIIRDS